MLSYIPSTRLPSHSALPYKQRHIRTSSEADQIAAQERLVGDHNRLNPCAGQVYSGSSAETLCCCCCWRRGLTGSNHATHTSLFLFYELIVLLSPATKSAEQRVERAGNAQQSARSCLVPRRDWPQILHLLAGTQGQARQ